MARPGLYWNAQPSGLRYSPRELAMTSPQTEPRTLRFSLVDDLRIRHLAQRTAPESF